MNMFKKGRKARDQDEAFGTLTGSDPAPAAKTSRGLTRKKKKQEMEEKPVFDLSSALPDSNDFRTSLLMPNLSARFSMLREQDDPNSKLGKASDDSVLFPKRASRLVLFNHNPLADIAEVESIHSTIRPPFAEERTVSISDGYASDDGGSIMNRSRPGEGNNLFGGRQKLYKVTTSSSRNLPGEGSVTSSKHMYESDVSLSSFQQLRLKEKEEQARQRELDEQTDRSSFPNADSEEQDSIRSPLNAFSKNRGTQSSTTSGPSHRPTSTAGTSVTSEAPITQQSYNGLVGKIKERDANSSAESIGFASSPSLRKIREEGGRPAFRLSQSRSAVNMRDNYSRQSPVPQAFRAMSPPLSSTSQPLDFGLRDANRSQASSRFNPASPTSLDSDQEETLANNVRPNDRGKATAMGLFNKPAQHYDDAQFQQRQMQMHEGRMSPLSSSSRAASRASPESSRFGYPGYTSAGSLRQREHADTPQMPPIPDYPSPPVSASPESNRRTSASSAGQSSTRVLRTKSSASQKARLESLIREQNAELAALEEKQLGPARSQTDENDGKGTFFDNSDDSDEERKSGRPSVKNILSSAPQPPPPLDVHPALRDGFSDFNFVTDDRRPSFPRNSNYSSSSSKLGKSAERHHQSEHESVISVEDVDSPTIPNTGLGLSGLIRTHLRHDSDKSSMLPPPSPGIPRADSFRVSMSSTTQTVSESVKSDPFEYDNDRLNPPQQTSIPPGPPTPTTLMSMQAQQMLSQAKALRDAAAARADATPKLNGHINDYNEEQPKEQPESPKHQRNASTETQREMQRFDEELAARRKRIEEGLRGVQERSRSRSPVGERGGFSLPRFPGRSNTGDRPEPQTKAMKMLGISQGSKDQQPSPRMPFEPVEDRSRNMSRQGNTSRQGQRAPGAYDHDQPYGRQTPTSGRNTPRTGPPRSTTPSNKLGARSRSNSVAPDYSSSRNRHIPDFDPSMMPGGFQGSPFTRPSPQFEVGQQSGSPADRAYDRSGSSAAGHYDRPGYFNSRPLVPPGPADMAGLTPRPSPRPSPNPASEPQSYQPQLAAPMSPPSSAQPSPNPAVSNGRSTPSSFQVPGRITPAGHRKRSVTKGMISEPTFVSSTSTVPLVHLPRDGGPSPEPVAPPIPAMNPRRRNTGNNAEPNFNPHPTFRPNASPMPAMPDMDVPPTPRQRNKLRKSSSEGGNMASRARQQALAAEFSREKDRSPNPNGYGFSRSVTNLGFGVGTQEGGMF